MERAVSDKKSLSAKTKRLFTRERSKLAFLAVFVIPTLAIYFYAYVIPIFSSIYSSFFDWSGFGNMTFVGIENYKNIFEDKVFFKAIRNDFLYVLGKEILIVPLAILFALALTRLRLKKLEIGAYRYILYLPNVLSVSVIGLVWAFILQPGDGVLNGLLKIIGLDSLIPTDGWLVTHAMPSVIYVASWCGIGYFMILLVSAINGISADIYEAADIDGAGQWRQLWSITIPAIWEKIRFVVTQIVIGTLGNYSLVMILLGASGGVDGVGMVMGLYVYYHGLDSNDPMVGYANAAAIILMIISSTIILLVNKLMNREED